MPVYLRWCFGLAMAVLVLGVPTVYHRMHYTEHKRLREVTPGVFYRSGQLTAGGFEEAVAHYHLRTIINLQDEDADPLLPHCYWGGSRIRESELCRCLGVRYVYLPPDLIQRRLIPAQRPAVIDHFLAVLDDPESYPVLIHCRAGMHRTGVMTEVYRMEYQGWTPRQAMRELKDNGFTEYQSTAANDYVTQYILTYRRGLRPTATASSR